MSCCCPTVPGGSAPTISCYYDHTKVNSQILSQTDNWTEYIEWVDIYADPKLSLSGPPIGQKLIQMTLSTSDVGPAGVSLYQGSYIFNGIGSIAFANGAQDEPNPNSNQVYLDMIMGGKGPFLLSKGYIATVYSGPNDPITSIFIYIAGCSDDGDVAPELKK